MRIAGLRLGVIGGSSGIGLAAVARASELGAVVFAGSRNPDARGASTDRHDENVRVVAVDALSRSSVVSFFDNAKNLDLLVVSISGGNGAGSVDRLSEDQMRDAFDRKFWAYWRIIQIASERLARTSSIVLVSAASARMARSGTSGLAAINGAINAMVGPLARELAPLRINAVCPGVIETAWWDRQEANMRERFFAEVSRQLPVGRPGTASEVADAVLMLGLNPYITGTILEVDGGLHLGS